MSKPPPALLTRASSKYLELIGEIPENTFLKAKSSRRLITLQTAAETKSEGVDGGSGGAGGDGEEEVTDPGTTLALAPSVEGEKKEEGSVLMNWAAKSIASVFTIAMAKRRAAKRAAKVYQRYWEPHWGAEYYYNPLTKQSFWEKPTKLMDEHVEFADEYSAALAAEHEAMKSYVPSPKTFKEKLAKMKEKNPKAGECDIVQPSTGEKLRSCMALWGMEAELVQVRCLRFEGPFRYKYIWNSHTDEEMDFRVFVFDRDVPGTTKFELVTATNPERGGIMSTFSRNKAVADYLEWPIVLEFYAYFASRPGTTLFNVFYTHSPFRSIITTANSAGAVWSRHFSFHAYEGIDIFVREAPEGDRFSVSLRNTLLDWTEVFKFVAFVKPVPGSIKLNVMQIFDPVHRFKISPSSVATRSGWTLVFSFYAFDVPMPGTTKYGVQQRRDPDECRVYKKMALKPWKDVFVFYAYDT